MEEEGAPEVEERMSNSRGGGGGDGGREGLPKIDFWASSFLFPPQPDTSDTEKVEGRGCRNFPRTQELDLELPSPSVCAYFQILYISGRETDMCVAVQ